MRKHLRAVVLGLACGLLIGAASGAAAQRCAVPTTVAFLELESTTLDGVPTDATPPTGLALHAQSGNMWLVYFDSTVEHLLLSPVTE